MQFSELVYNFELKWKIFSRSKDARVLVRAVKNVNRSKKSERNRKISIMAVVVVVRCLSYVSNYTIEKINTKEHRINNNRIVMTIK